MCTIRWRAPLALLFSLGCSVSPDPIDPVGPLVACEQVASADIGGDTINILSSVVEASAVIEGVSTPRHCIIRGQADERMGLDGNWYAVGFELRVPLGVQNPPLFFQGGGGTDGVVAPATGSLLNDTSSNALARGYAVVSTDGGHSTGVEDVSFGLDPQARLDYGYRAVGRVTRVAKRVLSAMVGREPERSFFVGCSNGGRQAFIAATRFAEEFDGIIAVAPALQLPKAALAQAFDTQQFFAATPPGLLPRNAFPVESLNLVEQAVLRQCDALDGLEDGIVSDPSGCQVAFDWEADVPVCQPGESNCLAAPVRQALGTVFDGARGSSGQLLYKPWLWDAGVAGAGWRQWKLDAGFAPLPLNTIVGAGALGYVFTTPPDAPDLSDGGLQYQVTVDLSSAAERIAATTDPFTQSAIQFMDPPDPTNLQALSERGGKVIVVHGVSDPVFSAQDTVDWYRALVAGQPDARSFARLYLVPGMNHCAGGPATDQFDLLAPLERWVEEGRAPEGLVARVDPNNPDVQARQWPTARERLLCPFPERAVWRGGEQAAAVEGVLAASLVPAVDEESASAFVCVSESDG